MAWETRQQKTTHQGRENSKLLDLQIQEGGGECIWNISEQIHGFSGHNGAKAKVCQRHYFDMCCTTCGGHTRTDRAHTPADYVASTK